jgi:aryl-alcohol dehydrogenase-like predicted oxidoreductase
MVKRRRTEGALNVLVEMDNRSWQVAAPRARRNPMRTVALGDSVLRPSVLGFGCSAVLGRVGRKASLNALAAAYDAGITFFDTARSYGYGESEALLGEFLHTRRDSVVISTKFGIRPAQTTLLKQSLKPLARKLLLLAPAARKAMQHQIAAQFSAGHFTVAALRQSLDTSLRALRTSYVDLLFMHEAPQSVLQQEDLLAALQQLVAEGKVRRFGISSQPPVIEAALAANLPGLRSVQFPCNLFDLGIAQRLAESGSDIVAIANHPFGGPHRIAASKALLASLSQHPGAPASLREKLHSIDDAILADAVLNTITHDTGIQVVVPSMLQLDHLRANIAAIEHSRFTPEDLHWLRNKLTATPTQNATPQA